jgi:hypothetical protein
MLEWIIVHAPDDAFMYLQLAKYHILYLRTNGFQPLWAYIITIIGLGVHGNALVFVDFALYMALIVSIPFVVKKLYNNWFGFIAWLIPAIWIGNEMMELAIAIVLIFIALSLKMKNQKGFWSALMTYARLDLVLLGIMNTVPWKQFRVWKAWKQFIIMCGCLIPWAIFNMVVFHTIIPDSMMHDSSGVMGALTGGGFNWTYRVIDLYFIPIPFIIVALMGCWKQYKLLIAEFVFLCLLDIIKNSAYAWHYTVIVPIIVLGYKEIWDWLKTTDSFKYFMTKAKVFVIVWAVAVSVILLIPIWNRAFKLDNFSYQLYQYNSRTLIVNGTRGAYNAGIQGYFSKELVSDTGGYFYHNVVMPEYFTDFSDFIPKGYTLVTDFGNAETRFGVFGEYKKVE